MCEFVMLLSNGLDANTSISVRLLYMLLLYYVVYVGVRCDKTDDGW